MENQHHIPAPVHAFEILGGAERTQDEFEQLFDAAGLSLNRIIPTKSPMKIIETTSSD